MNNDRRIVTKALISTGLVGALGSGYYLLKTNADLDLNAFIASIELTPGFEDLSKNKAGALVQLNTIYTESQTNQTPFIQIIKNKIQNDFRLKQITTFNNWQLSNTEALIIAAAIELRGIETTRESKKIFENAPFEPFLSITAWGPQETYQGVKFNEQSDGHCGLWFVLDEIPEGLQLYINGKKSRLVYGEKGFTSGIYEHVDEFINRVGDSEIIVYDEINHRKEHIGTFKVLPAFELHQYPDGKKSKVFSSVKKWGPQNIQAGEIFNPQPSGNAAFWFKVNSLSNHIQLKFQNQTFLTTVRKDIITSSIPEKYVPTESGQYPVSLFSAEHNETYEVGFLNVKNQ
ncbi:hypothetical protein [Marinicella rhabdoformis]|uniref:hypothetical protein n=1 Tax=Marinicella rhabdoformis TaxID=2580566 RepID=UPI0012AEDE6A|nr:hypothetical protein [Marinicella rhabdoformis]